MERARFIAFYIVKTVDSKDRFKSPKDVCSFDWDDDGGLGGRLATLEEVSAMVTADDWAKFSAEADEIMAQRALRKKQTQNGKHSGT